MTLRFLLYSIFAVILTTNWGCATASSRATPATPQVESHVLAKTAASWDGKTLPSYPTSQPEITILRLRIPPGTELPWHTHPVINAGVLISGELTVVTTTGQTLVLRAGDSIVEVVDTMHRGFSTGEEHADIIVFYAGTPGQAITVK